MHLWTTIYVYTYMYIIPEPQQGYAGCTAASIVSMKFHEFFAFGNEIGYHPKVQNSNQEKINNKCSFFPCQWAVNFREKRPSETKMINTQMQNYARKLRHIILLMNVIVLDAQLELMNQATPDLSKNFNAITSTPTSKAWPSSRSKVTIQIQWIQLRKFS